MTCPANQRIMLLAVAVVALGGGCVQRRMTIRSSPPGAAVYVDDYQIGTTPVSHDFVYYGTRKIRLVKDGYETLTVRQPIPAPWYEYFPLDFVSENLIPWEIRDERVIDQPQPVPVPGFQPSPAAPAQGPFLPPPAPGMTMPLPPPAQPNQPAQGIPSLGMP